MPELPEVETVAEGLRGQPIFNSTLKAVRVHWDRTVLPLTPQDLIMRLSDTQIQSLSRRAKYLFFALTRDGQAAGFIVAHLRMTGKFFVTTSDAPAMQYERLALDFHNGHSLRYCDPRKFGKVSWIADSHTVAERLGPEPHDPHLTSDKILSLLIHSSRAIKTLLLDQSIIGGLGNIYVDEALWLARIHPLRRGRDLGYDDAQRLREAMKTAIMSGLEKGGTSLGNGLAYFQSVSGASGGNQSYLNVFRRNGSPCPACGTTICKIRVAQRGTHFCPNCQPL